MLRFVLGFVGLGAIAHAQALKLVQTIPLPGVEGRIDHLGIDVAGSRLFVAALGNNTVEVVDLQAGRVVRSLTGFSEPQGLQFRADTDRLYVANAGDGSVRVLEGTTFAEVARVRFEDDADNIRYDAAARQVYVGYGSGALGIIDVVKQAIVGNIQLNAHPESFQLEQHGTRLFVNLPRAHGIAVVDRLSRRVVGRWSLGLVGANFALSLDEAHRRAFVACRAPARLLAFDLDSGTAVAKLDLHGDCDDLFHDAARGRIYAACGEGFIDVFTQTDADHYRLLEAVPTAAKARTCLFDGARIYAAAPRHARTEARILVFQCQP